MSRYIHRNPAEVKGACAYVLDKHRWSSFPAYVNRVATSSWLDREKTYKVLQGKKRYLAYRAFVMMGDNSHTDEFCKRSAFR